MRSLISVAHLSNPVENGPSVYESSIFYWREEDGSVYYANYPDPSVDFTTLQGTLVPENSTFDRWQDDLLEAPSPLVPDMYLKETSVDAYNPDRRPEDVLLLGEARILQMLQPYAHPNICCYHGAVRNGDFLAALCLRRYPITLKDAIEKQKPIDLRAVFEGILEGVKFIHSKDLAHNDINPRNIMLDDQDRAVVIDFDSCGGEGQHVLKSGTEAWMSDQPHRRRSSRHNDYFSLVLLSRWLRGQYDPYGDRAGRVRGPGTDDELQRALNNPTYQLDDLLKAFPSSLQYDDSRSDTSVNGTALYEP